MKKFFLFSLFLIISFLYGNQNEKIYKAIVLDNWKPYYFLDENNKPTGFAIDLFEEIIKESNVKVEYVIKHNATELIHAFKNKEVDLMPNLGYSVKRKNILDYSSFSDTSRLLLYKRVKSDKIKSIKDVKKVAVVSYNVGEKIVKQRFPTLNSMVFPDHFSALRALLSGEVDAFVYPEPIMEYTLNELNLEDKITSFGKSLSETKRAMAVLKGNDDLLKKLNSGLLKVKASGKYDEIHQKWFGKESVVEFTKSEVIFGILSIIFLSLLIISAIVFIGLRNKWLLTKKNLNNEIQIQKKELEQQNNIILIQAKNVAVGEMLANIAHQWRQPLNIMSIATGSIQLAFDLDRKIKDSELKEYIVNISNQVEYLSDTIENFRSFFSSKVDLKKEVNLKSTIKKISILVNDSLNKNNIKLKIDAYDYRIILKESAFIQVILNIINNAKDALLINNIDDDNRYVFLELKIVDDKVLVIIKDTAGGIDESISQKIFEPYFTTKEETQGSGLGLYMSQQIITNHLHGNIRIENTKFSYKNKAYVGATFIIELPSTDTKLPQDI